MLSGAAVASALFVAWTSMGQCARTGGLVAEEEEEEGEVRRGGWRRKIRVRVEAETHLGGGAGRGLDQHGAVRTDR